MSTTKVTDAMRDVTEVDAAKITTGTLPAGRYTNTTYSVQDGELSENNFTDADHTKLNGIETSATADQTKTDIEALGIDLPAANLTGTVADARLGTVSVSKGGTGATTHTSNNVLVGNGTSAIGSVAPSTSGNVLTSNGSSWASTAAAAGGKVAQIVTEAHTAYVTGSTNIPADDTIPQNTEGTEIIYKAIIPASATNRLLFIFEGNLQNSSTQNICFALFQDSGASSIAQGWTMCHMANHQNHIGFTYDMVAGTTSSIAFKIRMGGESGTYRTNGSSSARRYGLNSANRLTIIEYTP